MTILLVTGSLTGNYRPHPYPSPWKGPGVIFADEPTAELDSLTGMQVVKIFLEMKKSTTLVIATHDEALAAAADSVYEIEDGVLK